MKDTPADFTRWLLENKNLFTPYQERHGVMLAVDVANGRIAFDDTDPKSFIAKMVEAEQGSTILQTVTTEALRANGILPNRRAEVGLPNAKPPVHGPLGQSVHHVVLDDSWGTATLSAAEIVDEEDAKLYRDVLSPDQLVAKVRALCYAIEEIPASPQQTAASALASDLHQKLTRRWPV